MPPVADVHVKFSADTKPVDNAVDHVEKRLGGLGTVLNTAGGFILGTAINQVAQAFTGVISAGLDFGKQMANVNSILQLSDAGIKQLSADVLDLARNPGIVDTPAQLAAGLYQINSSGFAGAEGLQVLEASALAASAGLTSTDVAARAVSAVLNAFQLEASDAQYVSDLLFQTVNDGVISFEELANNLGNTIPLASSLGLALEDVFAAYAQLTLQGFSGSAAETNIAALMKTALSPTEALTAAITEQGYATAQQAIETLGLGGYVNLITDYGEEYGLTLTDMLGTQEAVNAALALGGDNAAAYAEEVERMNHASDGAGATQEALAKQMESASFQLDKARQSALILSTTIINWLEPAIASIASMAAGGLTRFTDWLTGAFALTFDFEKRLGKTNIEAFFSTLGITLENITGINLSDWFTRMGKAMQRPIDGAKKMFTALGNRNWKQLVAGIGDTIGSVPKLIGDAFKGIETGIEPLDKILHTVGKTFTDFGRLIQEIGQGDLDGFMVVLDRFLGRFGQIGEQLFDLLIAGVQAIPWGAVWDTAVSGLEAAASVGIKIATVFVEAGIELIGGISGAVGDLYGWIKGKLFGTQGGSSMDAGYAGAAGYHTAGGSADAIPFGDVIVEAGVRLIGGITNVIGNLYGWIKGQIFGDGTQGGASADPSYAGAAGYHTAMQPVDVGDIVISAAASALKMAWGAASTAATWAADQVKLVWDNRVAIGDVIVDGTVKLGTTLSGWIGRLGDWISGMLTGSGQSSADAGYTGAAGYHTGGGPAIKFSDWTLSVEIPGNPLSIDTSGIVSFIMEGFGLGGGGDNAGPGNTWYDKGSEIGTEIGKIVGAGIEAAFTINSIKIGGDGGDGGEGANQAGFIEFGYGLVDGIFQGMYLAFNTNVTEFLNETFASMLNSIEDLFSNIPIIGDAFEGRQWEFVIDAEGNIVLQLVPPDPGDVEADAAAAGTDAGKNAKQAFDLAFFAQFDNLSSDPSYSGASGYHTFGNSNGTNPMDGGQPTPDTRGGPPARFVTLPEPDITAFTAKIDEAAAKFDEFTADKSKLPAIDLVDYTASAVEIPTILGTNFDQALQLSSILSSAINTVVSANFVTLVDSVGVSVNQIPGIVTNAMNAAASSGAAAAFNAGASIGYGLANGINSTIDAVNAAATALAAAAENAANVRLERASPSKVFRRIGEDVGDGFVLGIQSRYGEASVAGSGLAGASIPNLGGVGSGYGSGGLAGPAPQKGGDTYVTVVNALRSEEFMRILEGAESGSEAWKFAKEYAQLKSN